VARCVAVVLCFCGSEWVGHLVFLPTQQRDTLSYTHSMVARCVAVLLCCCVGVWVGNLAAENEGELPLGREPPGYLARDQHALHNLFKVWNLRTTT